MKRHHSLTILAALILSLLSTELSAEVRLPSVLGDNMVLQRGQEVPVWGWDNVGQKVEVTVNGTSRSAVANEQGAWRVDLPAMPAGGPHKMTIAGSRTMTVENLLVGDVWFCSGQSNMEWTVLRSKNATEEIANADHPQIRHIKIPHRPAAVPQQNVDSDGWEICSPETVADFTGVGYYFARHLQQELGVPIGLIGCNWGGTRIEPWTPPVGFQATPALQEITDKLSEYPSRNADHSINHQSPLALYNGMVHPVLPYAVKGALWYQGESNLADGLLYEEKMKALIHGWREVWKQDLPFYFVQLAPYRYDDSPELLAHIWEAQLKALLIPNTGMAVTVDIGNVDDIHPTNKQDVGKRLALWALATTYGRDGLVYSGPLYKSMHADDGAIRIEFEHVGSGLESRDNKPLDWFTIAGEDKNFVQATAKIVGDSVVVSAPEVKRPVAVRFGWHQEAEPNLSNREGLPASPFRTDGW